MCPPGFTGTRCEQGKDGKLGPRQERLPGWGRLLNQEDGAWWVVRMPSGAGTLRPSSGPYTHPSYF